jgi:hypothetical protein
MAVITTAAAWGQIVSTTGSEHSGPPGAAAWGQVAGMDLEYGGLGTLAGLTEVQTGPNTLVPLGKCKVWILDQAGGYLVRQVMSDANGVYSVPYLNATKVYLAIAFDPSGQYDVAATRSLQVTTS